MSPVLVRNVLPVVTAVAASLYLATAVPHELVDESAVAPAQAEVMRCVARGRDADACLDEADGKALVESADWLARDDGDGRRGGR